MKYEWDAEKNDQNIRKHGFDFADAERVITSPTPFLVSLDCRKDYGEDRWQGIGILDGIVVVVIIFTERRSNIVRIISMRKAKKDERKQYEKRIKN